MATLTGQSINTSYQGLAKTADNGALGATEKNITDGEGNASTLSLGTASASFTGTLDLSGATVTGLPADVNTTYDLASAQSGSDVDVTLTGSDATTDTVKLVAGSNVTLTDNGSNQITVDATDTNTQGLVNGSGLDSLESDASLTGTAANASGARAIALGNGASAASLSGIALGRSANASAFQNALAFGSFATASADGSVALGNGVTAATADTVSVKALETQTASTPTAGGIIMTDAGSTARRLNIDASGNLQIDSTPVGGAGGLESGSGTDSMQSAASLTTTGANASGNVSIALGDNAVASAEDTISIGTGTDATSNSNIAIGNGAQALGDTAFTRRNIAIGENASANSENALACGAFTVASAATSTALGYNSSATGLRGLAVGVQAQATAFAATAIGNYLTATAEGAVALGGYSTNATAVDAIAIGKQTVANATGAIALGAGVTGSIADTASMKALELQTSSTPTAGGIIMADAGATDRRLNITSDGKLQVDSNPVGVLNAYASQLRQPVVSGYSASTYWRPAKKMHGRGWSWNNGAIDQGAGSALIVPLDLVEGVTVSTIGIPLFSVTANDTLEVAIYENNTTNNAPGTRVVYETAAVTTADNQTIKEFTLATPFTAEPGKMYWMAAMTQGGSSTAQLCYVSGDQTGFEHFTTTGSFGTCIPVNTLYATTAGNLPTSFASSTSYSHRDETVFYCWK